jgi:cytochrome b561
MQSTSYGFFRRILHLVVALSGLGLLAVGMLFFFFDVEGTQKLFGADTTSMLLKYHKSFGIVVLIAAVLILRSRRRNGVPAYDPPQPLVTRLFSKFVQWVIILGLIVMPILGLLATAASGHPIEFFNWTLPGILGENKALAVKLFAWHSQVGLVLLGAVILHLMGAYVHGRIAKDGINSRMGLL